MALIDRSKLRQEREREREREYYTDARQRECQLVDALEEEEEEGRTKSSEDDDNDKGKGVEEHRGQDPQGGGHEVREEPVGSDLFPTRSQIGQVMQGSLVRVARSLHQEGTHATRASSLPSKNFQLAIFFRALFVVLLVVLLLLLLSILP
ncbi:hypothetical protein RHMOL_Rhmol05G0235300 [Rhododendron molle]|uniref:Uncharacterized protein n=1 Tax=Rhododendron molle TaxID=49168 RepID=A0ACC0NSE6_RHOML|nr:hypothetical protein RHMOL_Rhmol05G0235300 [Rhododendron molle]